MDATTITYIWFAAALALALSEFIVPGFFIMFFGISAALVGVLRLLGIVQSLIPCLALWLLMGMGLFFSVGRFLRKHAQGERTVAVIDEDAAAYNQVVDVTVAIEPGGKDGRIRYQGSTWKARTLSGKAISAGGKARIIDRDNLCWIVEPAPSEGDLLAAQLSDPALSSESPSPQKQEHSR